VADSKPNKTSTHPCARQSLTLASYKAHNNHDPSLPRGFLSPHPFQSGPYQIGPNSFRPDLLTPTISRESRISRSVHRAVSQPKAVGSHGQSASVQNFLRLFCHPAHTRQRKQEECAGQQSEENHANTRPRQTLRGRRQHTLAEQTPTTVK
jgi:hypothetical protein